ncbi:hypothetical protein KUCAC02_000776 [Chaenocephalus aceratus]|uniref:Uncharacterized protein n=1 Tax=Chaenocephalus aceratus TaxID=36190 RepID=A0ACB9W7H5_CHAAC|nr:hypothetical protein KUCAC02_000776 [Chaenocephalus aceratus]
MIDTERAVGDAGPAEASSKSMELEKKKRSRVKQLMGDKLIDESDDGYVDVSVLASFNRMKRLTIDTKLIARAVKNSSVVEVNFEGDKVRRQLPIGDMPSNVDSRTVYVELLPKDVSHGWVEKVFTKCGNVVYVSIPRYKTTGDPKGFGFVEFETEEQAQRATAMLNNPPEDAPRKPGMFPKCKKGKPLPQPADNPQSKQEMEAEPSEHKRKRSSTGDFKSEDPGTLKTPEKKRRRSQTAEGPEGEIPSKMRKTSKCEAGEKEKDSTKTSKKEWLVLKDEYLTLQKKSMKSLKKCINQIHHQAPKKVVETKDDPKEEHVEKSEKESEKESEKVNNQGPQYASGVILKITDSKPLPARKVIKDALSKVSPVAYIDTLDGDSEGHIRFHTPEGAKAVSDVRAELQTEHSWALETLSGDHEQRYWQKILVDRQVKLNRPREKKRGTEKLISKAEKIILARAKEATKHIRFQED